MYWHPSVQLTFVDPPEVHEIFEKSSSSANATLISGPESVKAPQAATKNNTEIAIERSATSFKVFIGFLLSRVSLCKSVLGQLNQTEHKSADPGTRVRYQWRLHIC
jgi:hypothetical protein